jgi:hypothetical protein
MALIILSIPFYIIFVILAFSSIFGKTNDKEFLLKYPDLSSDSLYKATLFVRIGMFLGSFMFLAVAVSLSGMFLGSFMFLAIALSLSGF